MDDYNSRHLSTASNRLAEFFSPVTFQSALQISTISHQLLKFSRLRLCAENIEFLAKVRHYRVLLDEVAKSVYETHRDFIAVGSPSQINLTEMEHSKVQSEMKFALSDKLPSLEKLFDRAQNRIEELVYRDIYPSFVSYQLSVSAAKALARDRSKYGGLGDCFILTDPGRVCSCRASRPHDQR